jgi:hypothetical protein
MNVSRGTRSEMAASWAARLLKWMVTNFYPPGAWHSGRSWDVHGMQAKGVSWVRMAGPFSRGDTIINKTFTFTLIKGVRP